MLEIDLKKDLKALFNPPSKAPTLVEVPPLNFLMIDGQGDPNTSEAYRDAVQALYSVAYTLKFSLQKRGVARYSVMALEGLWWADDMDDFLRADKGAWRWTMMIMQPDVVTPEHVREAIEEAGRKKPLPALDRLRFERFDEGLSAQVMHIGPYATEGPTIQRLHAFIREQGYANRDKHHEIYLSDPNRTAPERMKTVIRQPVQKA